MTPRQIANLFPVTDKKLMALMRAVGDMPKPKPTQHVLIVNVVMPSNEKKP